MGPDDNPMATPYVMPIRVQAEAQRVVDAFRTFLGQTYAVHAESKRLAYGELAQLREEATEAEHPLFDAAMALLFKQVHPK